MDHRHHLVRRRWVDSVLRKVRPVVVAFAQRHHRRPRLPTKHLATPRRWLPQHLRAHRHQTPSVFTIMVPRVGPRRCAWRYTLLRCVVASAGRRRRCRCQLHRRWCPHTRRRGPLQGSKATSRGRRCRVLGDIRLDVGCRVSTPPEQTQQLVRCEGSSGFQIDTESSGNPSWIVRSVAR